VNPWLTRVPSMLRLRVAVVAFMLSIVAAFLLVLGAIYLLIIPRISVLTLRDRIERELPLGVGRVQVELWLKRERLTWSDIFDGRRSVGIGGNIPHIYRLEPLSDTQIDFEFHFNDNDELIRILVEECTFGL